MRRLFAETDEASRFACDTARCRWRESRISLPARRARGNRRRRGGARTSVRSFARRGRASPCAVPWRSPTDRISRRDSPVFPPSRISSDSRRGCSERTDCSRTTPRPRWPRPARSFGAGGARFPVSSRESSASGPTRWETRSSSCATIAIACPSSPPRAVGSPGSSTTARARGRRSSSSRSRSSRRTTTSRFSPPRNDARPSGCSASSAARFSPRARRPRSGRRRARRPRRPRGAGSPSARWARAVFRSRRTTAAGRSAAPGTRCSTRATRSCGGGCSRSGAKTATPWPSISTCRPIGACSSSRARTPAARRSC